MSTTLLPCPPPTTELTIHRLGPDDAGDLIDMFEQMSPQSRHMRFFTPMPEVPASTIRHLCAVDQDTHRAWLLRDGQGGPVIAEVRGVLDRDHPGHAEVALAVRDDWSGRGLGAALIDWIGADVAAAGATTLTCEVHPDNTRSRRLFKRAGFTFRFDRGSFVGQGPIPRERDCVPGLFTPAEHVVGSTAG